MKPYKLVGVYQTPMEACEAVGVEYKETNSRSVSLLQLKDTAPGAGRIMKFANGAGGLVINRVEESLAICLEAGQNSLLKA